MCPKNFTSALVRLRDRRSNCAISVKLPEKNRFGIKILNGKLIFRAAGVERHKNCFPLYDVGLFKDSHIEF